MGGIELTVGLYFASVLLFTYVLLGLATYQIRKDKKREPLADPEKWPRLSILVPTYNEEAVVPALVGRLLKLKDEYPGEVEIRIADDASTDTTLEKLLNRFSLSKAGTAGTWINNKEDVILEQRTENGGRAAAMNSALVWAKGDYIISTDADTEIEVQGLMKIIREMEADKSLQAMGGTILLSNWRKSRFLVGTQVIEYIRSFVYGRMGLNKVGENLIVSGAFGVFRKEAVEKLGGWREGFLAEDLDMTARVREELGGKVKFVPDPVAWTEGPSDLKSLANQRDRWYRGLTQSMIDWAKSFVRKRPKNVTLSALTWPIYVWTEWLAPIVQTLGIGLIGYHLLFGEFNMPFVAYLLATAYLLVILTSLWAIWLEQSTYKRYHGQGDTLKMVGLAFLEPFWYNPLHVYWRMRGLVKYLLFRDTSWGAMKRVGAVVIALLALAPNPAEAQYIETSAFVEVRENTERLDLSVYGWVEPFTAQYRQVHHNGEWDDQLKLGLLFDWTSWLNIQGTFGYSPNTNTRLLPTFDLGAGVAVITGPLVWQPQVRTLIFKETPDGFLDYTNLVETRGTVSWYVKDTRLDAMAGHVMQEGVWWGGGKVHQTFFGKHGFEIYGYAGKEILDFPIQVADSKSAGANAFFKLKGHTRLMFGMGAGQRDEATYTMVFASFRFGV